MHPKAPYKNIPSRYPVNILRTIALAALCAGATVRATLVWDGSPSKGLSVFKSIHIQDANNRWQPNPSPNGSSVGPTTDAKLGSIWRFNKAAADHRCEGNAASGVSPKPGNTFYL